MKQSPLTKEELQEQLKAIAKKEEKEIIEKNYPEFKKYEGRFFRQSNNYGCPKKPSDYWWYYTKVIEVRPEDVYDTRGNGITSHFKGWSFQLDKYNQLTVELEKTGYIHSLGQEISQEKFNNAWNKAMENLDKLP